MLVVAKMPPIRVEIFGDGIAELVTVLRKAIPGVSITPDPNEEPEEFVDVFETEWYKSIKATHHAGITVRTMRENAGMTQADLSEKSGVSIPNISMIENGKRVVGPRTARKLAAVFDLDFRRLL